MENNHNNQHSDHYYVNHLAQTLVQSVESATRKSLNESPPHPHLSAKDIAPGLHVDAQTRTILKGGGNGSSFQNPTGYRMVRCSHGVSRGNWFYELEILDTPSFRELASSKHSGGNIRLGHALKEHLTQGLVLEEQLKRHQKNKTKEKDFSSNGGKDDTHHPNEKPNEKPNEDATEKRRKRLRREQQLLQQEPKPMTQKDNADNNNNDNNNNNKLVGGHLRVGWAMRTAQLQAPVGYDRWSYGVRSLLGSRIHNSRREDFWGGEPFEPGDVVGLAICLVDPKEQTNKKNSESTVERNHIRVFINGKSTGHFIISRGIKKGGEAFDNIRDGTYYPALSSYMGGAAKFNIGPHFIYPVKQKDLPSNLRLRPFSEIHSPPPEPSCLSDAWKKDTRNGAVFGKFKKTEETLIHSFSEAIKREAELRKSSHDNHILMQIKDVRAGRFKRGLGTSDLPNSESHDNQDAKE